MSIFRELYEEEDDQGFWLAQDRDVTVTIKPPHTAEEADKALQTKDNYGRYISTMRNSKVSQKDVEEYFGPRSPNVKNVKQRERYSKFIELNPDSDMTYQQWLVNGPVGTDVGPYPVNTKAAYDAFVNQFITKPTLLRWAVVGDRLIFPKESNPGRNEVKNIVTTVLTNAGFPPKSYKFSSDVTEGKLKEYIKEELNKRSRQ